MLTIGDYTTWLALLIVEAAKYLFVLVFALLGFRLGRFSRKSEGTTRRTSAFAALVFSGVSILAGYFCVRHSLSLLYYHYGEQAFEEANLPGAGSLFATAANLWRTPDTQGKLGVVLLLLEQAGPGGQLLREAQEARGSATAFEQFYEGLHFFLNDKPREAIPLLEAASTNNQFRWKVIKIFSVIQIDWGDFNEARRLFAPYRDLPVDHSDQALIMMTIHSHEGNASEARFLYRRFFHEQLSPFWKKRFQRVGTQFGLTP